LSSRRRAQGFSLIEVLIVIIVVALALLGTIASMTFGLKSSKQAERLSEATNYARESIGLVRDQGLAWATPLDAALNDSESTRRDLNAAPLTAMPAGTNMKRNIQVLQGTGPGELANVARVRVRVYWTIDGHEKSVELVAFQRRP